MVSHILWIPFADEVRAKKNGLHRNPFFEGKKLLRNLG